AAPLLRIEEHAHAAVDVVLLVAEDLLVVDNFREALLRGLFIETEVLRQTREVAFGDDNRVIAAAVTGTLRAVVERARRCGFRISHRMPRSVGQALRLSTVFSRGRLRGCPTLCVHGPRRRARAGVPSTQRLLH